MKPAPARRTQAPSVDIKVDSPLWADEPNAEATVREAIAAAAEMLAADGGEVSVVLTGDAQMQELNRTWRKIDKPTNVLSFPAPSPRRDGMLGDIVIAYEALKRECEAEELLFAHHLAHLTVHGFLHLIGYDHHADADAEAMEALESKIMARLDMPDPYLARDTD